LKINKSIIEIMKNIKVTSNDNQPEKLEAAKAA